MTPLFVAPLQATRSAGGSSSGQCRRFEVPWVPRCITNFGKRHKSNNRAGGTISDRWRITHMRAITLKPGVKGSARLPDLPQPPRDAWVLVRTLALGLCGTDREIISAQ